MKEVERIAPSLSLPFNHGGGGVGIPNSKKKIMKELSTNIFSNTRDASSVDDHPLNECKKNHGKLDIIDNPMCFQHNNNNNNNKPEKPREWTLVNHDSSIITNEMSNVDSTIGSGNDSGSAMNIIVETSDSHCWRREQGRTRSSSSSIASSITEDVGTVGIGIGIGGDNNADVPDSYYYNEETTISSHMNANLPPLYHRAKKKNDNNNIVALNNDNNKNHSSSDCHTSSDNHSNNHDNNNYNSSISTLCSDDAFSYIMNISSHSASSSSSYSVNSNTSLKSDEHALVEHIVLPKDTMQGLCLKYKTNVTRLRQVNQFSGSNLSFAPKKLYIPIKHKWREDIKFQDTTTEEYKIHKVLSECSKMGIRDIKAYLELHDWDVHKSIKAAKADKEWEKSQSSGSRRNSIIGESKSWSDNSIEPPPTSYYRIEKSNMNVNLRLTGTKRNHKGRYAADMLLELKVMKDAAERWEELSHPNSYKSYVDDSMPLMEAGVPMRIDNNNHNEKHHTACAEDYYKAPPIDFGIEMKEMGPLATHPDVVTVPR